MGPPEAGQGKHHSVRQDRLFNYSSFCHTLKKPSFQHNNKLQRMKRLSAIAQPDVTTF